MPSLRTCEARCKCVNSGKWWEMNDGDSVGECGRERISECEWEPVSRSLSTDASFSLFKSVSALHVESESSRMNDFLFSRR